MEKEQEFEEKLISSKQSYWAIFSELGLKTIYFNFKYLPFKQAIRLPILVSKKVSLREARGQVVINSEIRTGMIKIGFSGVGIFDYKYSRTIWQVAGKVVFNGRAHIGHGSKISVGPEGRLVIGDNFIITAESSIVASEKTVEFGNDCLLSWDVLIMDTDFHSILDANSSVVNPSRDVKIGNHVWVGCRTTILKGSDIEDNCIIASNSLVTKSLTGTNKLFGGQPARELKSNVTWKK